jgi:type IX secretion system PorP/SprF family membrane protein
MKKLILIISIIVLAAQQSFAQQEPMLSQYMFNGLFLNPAYAGSHDNFSATLLGRKQWAGFNGAPNTVIASVDGPLLDHKMGLGLILSNDQIGVTCQTDVYANYSYHIKTSDFGHLAFGLKAGFSQYTARLSDLKYWDAEDVVFMGNRNSAWLMKAGFGMYYYTPRFYAGLSIPSLLAYDPQRNFSFDVNQSSQVRKHYYLTSGYIFNLSPDFMLKPSVLLKYETAAPLQADINLNLLYKNRFWLGASYRTGDAVVIIAEVQATKRFRIGYSYDWTLSEMNNYSSGTHEVMIGYEFGKDLMKIKTPRYF